MGDGADKFLPQTSPVRNAASRSVKEAIDSRRTIRFFQRDKVVPQETLREIVTLSSRAPSGGNVQPWKIYVLGPDKRDELVTAVQTNMVNKVCDISCSGRVLQFKTLLLRLFNNLEI
jgi:nitroreductase